MFQRPLAPAIVSVLIVVMFGAAMTLMLLRPAALTSEQVTILNVLLGSLSAGFGTVTQYWLGSSSGSRAKDDTIADLGKKPT